jgi:hypothetical protein
MKIMRYSESWKDPFGLSERRPKSPPIADINEEYKIWQQDSEPGDRGVEDPLAYWIKRQDRYPRLSRMAMDFLVI